MSDIKAEPLALLDLVTTLAEIEKRWFYSANTVREWILDGKIRARQSGRVWLIEVPSLLAFLAWRESVKLHDLEVQNRDSSCSPAR